MSDTWTWISADGAVRALSGFTAGVEVLDGVKGRYMPPVRRDRSTKAGQAGSTLTAVDFDTRTLEVPVLVRASSESAFVALVRDWLAAFAPDRGDGTIKIDTTPGDTRLLTCRYVEGLELDEVLGESRFPGAASTTLVFEADRPFWAPPDPWTRTWTLDATAGSFFPIFPLRLGASQIFSADNVDTGSDVDVYPVWTITGPASQIVVTRLAGGDGIDRVWKWGGTLGPGELLTVDTRPIDLSGDPKSVRDALGGWRFGELADGKRDLWPFTRGVNFLRIEMSGTDAATSKVRVDVVPQYLGA